MVSLKLFAGASLETEQGPLRGAAAQRRRLALLALLAASHPGAHPREKLTACLWPERDSEHARNLLSQAVYVLRKALGEEAILAAGDELRFNPGVVGCDVVRFEQALAAGDLERAVELYSGPFLDGFFLSDAPEFEHWVEGERERYGRAYGTALEGLAERAAAESDFAGAAEWWRRRVAAEPYNARVTLRLMEALEAAGDRAGALRQARVHATLLEQEFGAEPDPAVMALAERLRTQPAIAASSAGETRALEPPHAPGELEAQASPVGEPPAAGDPLNISTSRPPTARAPRGHIPWKRVALPIAAVLGFAAALAVGWLLPGPGAPPGVTTEGAASSTKAIVVLPCANLSRDPEEEYFSDGLTEELIGVLSQVRALQVVARTSAFAFKGKDQDIREIGRALGVGTVLECSVRREAERIRVTAQLINASDGFHLWSQSYDHEGTDIFAIQTDVALQIVRALEAELTPAERARLAHRPTANPEAHVLYLKGRHFWAQRNRGGFARAIEYFERAIQADPQYAAAYAGLASAYGPRGVYSYIAPGEARERTREAALQAVELDDGLAEAHSILASYLFLYEWDWPAAEREFLRAIELDPSYPTGHMWYSYFLESFRRFEEAVQQAGQAVELDPLSPIANAHLGRSLGLTGRADLGAGHLHNALELDSTFWIAHMYLGETYETTGQRDLAVRAFQTATAHAGSTPDTKAALARGLVRVGRQAEARQILEALEREAAETGVHPPMVATVYLALGDTDAALAWLEESVRQRHPAFPHAAVEPAFAPLHADRRFGDLLRRVGLTH